jgi:hypothetical protein
VEVGLPYHNYRKREAMSKHAHERSISTTAYILMAEGTGQPIEIYRELVLQENEDGTWLVYTLRPKTAAEDHIEELTGSGSIKVEDHTTRRFLGDLFSLLANPEAFSEGMDPK